MKRYGSLLQKWKDTTRFAWDRSGVRRLLINCLNLSGQCSHFLNSSKYEFDCRDCHAAAAMASMAGPEMASMATPPSVHVDTQGAPPAPAPACPVLLP